MKKEGKIFTFFFKKSLASNSTHFLKQKQQEVKHVKENHLNVLQTAFVSQKRLTQK